MGKPPARLYCGALEDEAAKVEAKAVEGFRACMTAATQQSWYNNWSRLCERELNQLQPVEFPLASEIKPEAASSSLTIAPAPLVPLD